MPETVISNKPLRMQEEERLKYLELLEQKRNINVSLDRLEFAENAVRVKNKLLPGVAISTELRAEHGLDAERDRLNALKTKQESDQAVFLADLRTKYELSRDDTIDWKTGRFSRA